MYLYTLHRLCTYIWLSWFLLIHREQVLYLPDWLCALRSVGVEPKRLRPVIQQTGTPPCLLLLEGKKGGKPGMRWLKPLALKTRSGVPTSELKAIYGGTK